MEERDRGLFGEENPFRFDCSRCGRRAEASSEAFAQELGLRCSICLREEGFVPAGGEFASSELVSELLRELVAPGQPVEFPCQSCGAHSAAADADTAAAMGLLCPSCAMAATAAAASSPWFGALASAQELSPRTTHCPHSRQAP